MGADACLVRDLEKSCRNDLIGIDVFLGNNDHTRRNFHATPPLFGCALPRLHSQPLIILLAARYRACIRSRSLSFWLRATALAFAAAHYPFGCALPRLHSQPLIILLAARYRACIRSRSLSFWLRATALAFAAAHYPF